MQADIHSRDSSGERHKLQNQPSGSIDNYLDTHILKEVPTEKTFGFGLSINASKDNIR